MFLGSEELLEMEKSILELKDRALICREQIQEDMLTYLHWIKDEDIKDRIREIVVDNFNKQDLINKQYE